MEKLELKKDLKQFYTASKTKVQYLEVPERKFLMVDGKGDPNGPEFQQAVEALYAVAYTLKFMVKKGTMQLDYPVMPLEGLWWVDGAEQWSMTNREDWRWTAMIMKPKIISQQLLEKAKVQVEKKKTLPAMARLVLVPFHEGFSAQMMHIGPYATEPATIAKMDAIAKADGYEFIGKHHEIYLSDPRRTKPALLKTILRHPVKKISS